LITYTPATNVPYTGRKVKQKIPIERLDRIQIIHIKPGKEDKYGRIHNNICPPHFCCDITEVAALPAHLLDLFGLIKLPGSILKQGFSK
jgi:hypothetical protein